MRSKMLSGLVFALVMMVFSSVLIILPTNAVEIPEIYLYPHLGLPRWYAERT